MIRPARRRFAGSAVWLLIGGSAAAIVSSGFVLGAFVIGSFGSTPLQSAAFGAPMPPPGVSYVAAQDELVGPSTVPASGACVTSNLGTLVTPTALTNGTTTVVCLTTNATGFAQGDQVFTYEISFSHLAANATIFQIQIGIDVTPASHDVLVASYVKTSASIVSQENVTFAIDLSQAGDTSIVQYNFLVTEL